MRVLRLAGDPEARGLAHGEQLRAQIADGLDAWEASVAPDGGGPRLLEAFLADAGFEPALRAHADGFLTEVAAIARGARQPYRRVLAYNLLDELWCWEVAREGSFARAPGACSTIGLPPRPERPTVAAQNLDLTGAFADNVVALELAREDAPAALCLSSAGALGYCGCNEAGVAVCCNALLSMNARRSGLPVLAVVRRVLEQRDAAAAVRLLHELPHASPQSYMVADPAGLRHVECSPARVVELDPAAGASWHTNHPLANDDVRGDVEPGDLGNSLARGAFLAEAVGGVATARQAAALLADRSVPVCRVDRDPQASYTWATIVMELTVPPRVSIAPGPPDRTPLRPVWR